MRKIRPNPQSRAISARLEFARVASARSSSVRPGALALEAAFGLLGRFEFGGLDFEASFAEELDDSLAEFLVERHLHAVAGQDDARSVG